jgi:hypothetical protein
VCTQRRCIDAYDPVMTVTTSTERWQADLRGWFEEQTAEDAFSGHALVWREQAPLFSYVGGLAHRGHGVPIAEDTR